MPEYPAYPPPRPVLAARPVPCFPRTKRPPLLPAWSLTGPERPSWMQWPLMMFPDHYRASDSLRRTVRRVVSPLVLGCLGDIKYHPKVIHHKVAGWPSRRCHVSCLSSFWLKHSVYAEDLKTGKSAARPFLMGFPGGPWAPLHMVSFMDPPMLFIMVFELIKAIPF